MPTPNFSNHNHPELCDGECWIGNTDVALNHYTKYKSARYGQLAYDKDGILVKGLKPVFALQSEVDARKKARDALHDTIDAVVSNEATDEDEEEETEASSFEPVLVIQYPLSVYRESGTRIGIHYTEGNRCYPEDLVASGKSVLIRRATNEEIDALCSRFKKFLIGFNSFSQGGSYPHFHWKD